MAIELEVKSLLTNKNAGFEIREPRLDRDLDYLKRTLTSVKESLDRNLGPTPEFQISIPYFFLLDPLSEDKRKLVDTQLSEYYAQRSVLQQEVIATVPIKESSEKMVFLPKLFQEYGLPLSLSDLPFNKACGEWADKPRVYWVRESMANRLSILAKALTQVDLLFHIEDAFRPVGVQEGLFKRRVDWIQSEHPDWNWEKILLEAKSKTAVSPRLASHKSGAAIDITLRKISDCSPLDLGNKYPEGGALVAIDCPFVTVEQWQTRQLFVNSFRIAGFAIYDGEDWHASYLDNLAGVKDGRVIREYTAKYGPIKKFDDVTGEIISFYEERELNVPFTD